MSELALAAFAAHTDSHLIDRAAERALRALPARVRRARLPRPDSTQRGLRWLPRSSPRFPPALGAIFDPPAGLFVRGRGELELLDRPAVAIVGARSCSSYGADVARMLGRELAAAGLVVISGLARGVDGQAHRGALDAGGQTVAVLGCGIDRDYPAAHAELATRDRASAAWSSPSTRRASSRRRGASRPATASSPASRRRRSSSRPASGAAR